jgi:hypothetical protein
MENMAPCDKDIGVVELRNIGSVQPDHVDIECSYTVDEGEPIGDPDGVDTSLSPDDFAKYLEITSFEYRDDTWWIRYEQGSGYTIYGVPDGGDDWRFDDTIDGVPGSISLCDLKNDPLLNLPPTGVSGGSDTRFEMTVHFHEDAGNDLQGDTLYLTMIFTMNQHSSQ